MGHPRPVTRSSHVARWHNSCVILDKYVVPRHIEPEIVELSIKRGQSDLLS